MRENHGGSSQPGSGHVRDRSTSIIRALARKGTVESNLSNPRHRSSTLRELAPVPESIDLDAVDEDLKLNLAPAAEKVTLLVDILRALIFLRTRTLPIIWHYISKVFLTDEIESHGKLAVTSTSTTADASLINRIFGKLTVDLLLRRLWYCQ